MTKGCRIWLIIGIIVLVLLLALVIALIIFGPKFALSMIDKVADSTEATIYANLPAGIDSTEVATVFAATRKTLHEKGLNDADKAGKIEGLVKHMQEVKSKTPLDAASVTDLLNYMRKFADMPAMEHLTEPADSMGEMMPPDTISDTVTVEPAL